ncbi:GIY-YIG nuclease family protein [Candidatus Falkowbacteria bacterium]|nr:GIY-YIG nuclease family protein [Candidatus Falkowbacteria bacterium]
MKQYCVYIMTNKIDSVDYTGITNDLFRRVYEHKTHFNEKSFTSKYNINKLVYFEEYNNPKQAINREKQIKGLSREKKFNLIKTINPNFNDLARDWYKDNQAEHKEQPT